MNGLEWLQCLCIEIEAQTSRKQGFKCLGVRMCCIARRLLGYRSLAETFVENTHPE